MPAATTLHYVFKRLDTLRFEAALQQWAAAALDETDRRLVLDGKALHADLVGACNIALRTLLAWQDWASTDSCQNALMCRAMKPKPHSGNAMRSCGGA